MAAAWWEAVVAATVASTATPMEPPIWMAVVDTPDTRPECSSFTPDTAVRGSCTKARPRAAERAIRGNLTPGREPGGGRPGVGDPLAPAVVAGVAAARGGPAAQPPPQRGAAPGTGRKRSSRTPARGQTARRGKGGGVWRLGGGISGGPRAETMRATATCPKTPPRHDTAWTRIPPR